MRTGTDVFGEFGVCVALRATHTPNSAESAQAVS